MSADEILVTFPAIVAAQADVAKTHQNLNQQLDDLKAFLAPMVATWTGSAATNYQAKQQAWDTAAADINVILALISQRLGQANESFGHIEQINTNIFS